MNDLVPLPTRSALAARRSMRQLRSPRARALVQRLPELAPRLLRPVEPRQDQVGRLAPGVAHGFTLTEVVMTIGAAEARVRMASAWAVGPATPLTPRPQRLRRAAALGTGGLLLALTVLARRARP